VPGKRTGNVVQNIVSLTLSSGDKGNRNKRGGQINALHGKTPAAVPFYDPSSFPVGGKRKKRRLRKGLPSRIKPRSKPFFRCELR